MIHAEKVRVGRVYPRASTGLGNVGATGAQLAARLRRPRPTIAGDGRAVMERLEPRVTLDGTAPALNFYMTHSPGEKSPPIPIGNELTAEEIADVHKIHVRMPHDGAVGSTVTITRRDAAGRDLGRGEWFLPWGGNTLMLTGIGQGLDNGTYVYHIDWRRTDGLSGSGQFTLHIINSAPRIEIRHDEEAHVGIETEITVRPPSRGWLGFPEAEWSDSTADYFDTGLVYRIDWDGDGTVDETLRRKGYVPHFLHAYDRPGRYQVRITAEDKDGGVSAVATRWIDVVEPPVVQPPVHSGVTFDIVRGHDDDSVLVPNATAITFGEQSGHERSIVVRMAHDGTGATQVKTTIGPPAGRRMGKLDFTVAQGNTFGYRFGAGLDDGTYIYTVAWSRADGSSGYGEFTIRITNEAPVIEIHPDMFVDTPLRAGKVMGIYIYAYDSWSDHDAGIVHRIDWDGDGTVDEVVRGERWDLPYRHIYDAPGRYQIRVTAEDAEGAISEVATYWVSLLGAADGTPPPQAPPPKGAAGAGNISFSPWRSAEADTFGSLLDGLGEGDQDDDEDDEGLQIASSAESVVNWQ